jgi:putative restriction endonuclease
MANPTLILPNTINVGTLFPSRKALYDAGLHRHLMAGISGDEEEGADAIVISGGYEDDQDKRSDEILYTGQGGRDEKTGRQVADQELTRGNLALMVNRTQGLPVRVFRKTARGYQYAGLFSVQDAWHERGRSGYRVWRYRLVATGVGATADALVSSSQDELGGDEASEPARKRSGTTVRMIRDTAKARQIKRRYDWKCQVCGTRLVGPAGPYAEAAHIRPLGSPHNGPDTFDNLLCLCPNHHVLFDLGAFTIRDDYSLIGIEGALILDPKHALKRAHLAYHREHYGW